MMTLESTRITARNRSSFVRRRAAHQRHDFVGGHLEITARAEALDQFPPTRLAASADGRLDQTDNASLHFELDIGTRHKSGAFPNILGDGHLAFGGNPHKGAFLTNKSRSYQ